MDTNIVSALWQQRLLPTNSALGGLELCICSQTIYELWVVGTRPGSSNGLGLPTERVHTYLRELREVMTWLVDPIDLCQQLVDLCRLHDVKGRPAHDARLAMLAIAHGIDTIITLNPGDFKRYGLNVISPQLR